MVWTCQLIEISLKMRNRFLTSPWPPFKGAAQSPKLCTEFIFHLFKNVRHCYLASVQRKGLDNVCFNFPPMMKRYIDNGRSRNVDHTVPLLTPQVLVTNVWCMVLISKEENESNNILALLQHWFEEHIISCFEQTIYTKRFKQSLVAKLSFFLIIHVTQLGETNLLT